MKSKGNMPRSERILRDLEREARREMQDAKLGGYRDELKIKARKGA